MMQIMTEQAILKALPKRYRENHDQCRSVTRFCKDKNLRYEVATFFATILYTMKGTPYILQGQEFGTPDAKYDCIDCFEDIETINFYKENDGKIPKEELMRLVNFGSRDNGRRPMLWNGKVNGGFNAGAKPWLDIHSEAGKFSLEKDLNSDKSVFAYYKKIIALRKATPAFVYGTFNDETEQGREKDYFKYTMTYWDKKYLVVINYDKSSEISVPDGLLVLGNYLFVGEGENPKNGNKTFRPYETAIYDISER